jgi:hypothetical protein
MFDKKRFSEYMHLPVDWPRINQFPEYFTVEKGDNYSFNKEPNTNSQVVEGSVLANGYPVKVKKGETIRLIIRSKIPGVFLQTSF